MCEQAVDEHPKPLRIDVPCGRYGTPAADTGQARRLERVEVPDDPVGGEDAVRRGGGRDDAVPGIAAQAGR